MKHRVFSRRSGSFGCFVALVAALMAGPALSDPCRDEIAALFTGGALDPFERPARREKTIRFAPDGTETVISEVEWLAVRRSLTRSGGMYFLNYDTEMWLAQSADGPWTRSPSALPADFEDMTRAQNTQRAANLTETECLGSVELGQQSYAGYRYRTRTDETAEGSWFGGYFTTYLDPETGQLMRLELREAVSSWQPEPTKDVDITTVIYDPDLTITKPE